MCTVLHTTSLIIVKLYFVYFIFISICNLCDGPLAFIAVLSIHQLKELTVTK